MSDSRMKGPTEEETKQGHQGGLFPDSQGLGSGCLFSLGNVPWGLGDCGSHVGRASWPSAQTLVFGRRQEALGKISACFWRLGAPQPEDPGVLHDPGVHLQLGYICCFVFGILGSLKSSLLLPPRKTLS